MTGPGHRAPRELIGRTFGAYEIIELLGEGGMGAVYLARHRSIGRKAAIKVLHPTFANEREVVQRFFNEARAVNLVGHPSIVDIYDHGQAEGVGAYLVMEYLAGEALEQRLARDGRLSPTAVAQLIGRIAAPLAAAHEAGVVHRDLKPANIFLVPDVDHPGEQRIKLLDFGIAKLLESETGAALTRTGTVIGTPIYMSPEQCRGAKHLDHRTDVYALGVIAYEMLCGHPPFASSAFGEILVKHLTEPPPPLGEQGVAVPEPMEAAVMQALAKTADQRFQSVAAFAQALGGGTKTGSSAELGLAATIAPSAELGLAATQAPQSFPNTRISNEARDEDAGSEQPQGASEPGVDASSPPTAAVAATVAAAPAHSARLEKTAATPATVAAGGRSRGPLVALIVGLVLVLAGSAAAVVFALREAPDPSTAAGRANGGGAEALAEMARAVAAGGATSSAPSTTQGADDGSDPPATTNPLAAPASGQRDPPAPPNPLAAAGSPKSATTKAEPPAPPKRRAAGPLARLPPAMARAYRNHQYRLVLYQAFAFFNRHSEHHRAARSVLTAGVIAACRVKNLRVADLGFRKLRGRHRRYAIRGCRRAGIPMR